MNLNIYTPKEALENETRLPVLVWIHGGSFYEGSNHDEADSNPGINMNDPSKVFKSIFCKHFEKRLGKPKKVTSLMTKI